MRDGWEQLVGMGWAEFSVLGECLRGASLLSSLSLSKARPQRYSQGSLGSVGV